MSEAIPHSAPSQNSLPKALRQRQTVNAEWPVFDPRHDQCGSKSDDRESQFDGYLEPQPPHGSGKP